MGPIVRVPGCPGLAKPYRRLVHVPVPARYRRKSRHEQFWFPMGPLSKLGRYDIVRVLGKGAMGTVYEAYDPNLERRVALKTISIQGLSSEGVADYEARFRTEARSAARLQHPNIVSVYDSGRDGDVAYLVMEYVEGQDLKHHLDRGLTFTLEQTVRIMRDLLSALAYAHAQNIVHRDVKPANLLIEADGRIKLADFGVARMQDAGDATRTRGTMVGTLKYMSPEQVQGQSVDARADLFSAGIVLYQLLTARQPFTGDNEFAIIAQIIGVDPPAPSTWQPGLPPAVDALLARALAKSREHRFADARAFRDALVLACDQVPDQSTAPMPLEAASGPETAGRQSGSSGAARSLPTVTQEIELVYWKDVRDSDDALDLQGFLDRFPDGIYADLARRRLRKLGVVFVGEQTATRIEPREPDPATAAVASTEATQPTSRAATAASTPAQQATDQVRLDRRRRQAVRARSAVVAMLLLATVLVVWWQAGDGRAAREQGDDGSAAVLAPPQGVSVPTGPASDAVGAAAAAATAVTAQLPAARAGDQPEKLAAPAPAQAPSVSAKALASRASAAGDTRTGTAAPGARPTPSPVAAQGSSTAPVSETAAEPRVSVQENPEQACTGRILLGYQICMSEQCAKPTLAQHPVCEQRRLAEQARKQQQLNRN